MSRIFCVDFDGTIVGHAFPEIGDEMPGAFDVLKELKAAGHKLILWTCREDEGRNYLTEAVDFCRTNGVEFDAVNATIDESDFRPEGGLKRKPFAHCYIDDRNLLGFPGWHIVRETVFGSEWD